MSVHPDPVAMSAYLKDFVRPGAAISAIDYFVYNANVAAVVQNTATQMMILTQSDSDFVLTNISGAGIAAAAPTPRTPATLQITDTGTGKTFFNQATLFEQICGLGGFSFTLPTPRVIMPNTKLLIDLLNLGVANVDIWLSLIGARIYYATPGDATAAGIPR